MIGVGEANKIQGGGVGLDLTFSAGIESGKRAFAMAGVKPADIKYASIYDSFTITVVMQIEDLGFCEKGKGGRFVSDGNLISGVGKLPFNTDGGGLCSNHPGNRGGMTKVIEAVRQARGEAHVNVGRRRIPTSTQRQAISLTLIAMGLLGIATFALLSLTRFPFEAVLFEAISAFATVGLSTGITPVLPVDAQVVIAAGEQTGQCRKVVGRHAGQAVGGPQGRHVVVEEGHPASEHSPAVEGLAHDRRHRAEVLAHHIGPGPVGGHHHQVQQFVVGELHIGPASSLRGDAEQAEQAYLEIFRQCHKRHLPNYLSVLKRHRPDDFLMSYALDGYSMAMDFRITRRNKANVVQLTRELDEIVLKYSGKFYLAKDSTLRPAIAAAYLGEDTIHRFATLKRRLDPENLLESNLWRRVFAPITSQSESPAA